MTIKIHHNTLKRAKSLGFEIVVDAEDSFSVFANGEHLSTARTAKDAVDLAVLETSDEEEHDEEDLDGEPTEEEVDDEGEGESKSIVKAKYKQKYRPTKMTNGDDLAQKIRAAFMTQKDEDTGKPRLDYKAFVKFAKANGVWSEAYATLPNHGMVRMNVANRLRAKIRNDKEFEIQW